METEQLVQLLLLIGLLLERIIKNSKHFKSKCCCIEIEQENMSPKPKTKQDIELKIEP
jgi:hypothetical protein